MFNSSSNKIVMLSLIAMLSACGGGGGSSDSVISIAPSEPNDALTTQHEIQPVANVPPVDSISVQSNPVQLLDPITTLPIANPVQTETIQAPVQQQPVVENPIVAAPIVTPPPLVLSPFQPTTPNLSQPNHCDVLLNEDEIEEYKKQLENNGNHFGQIANGNNGNQYGVAK